jgi:hypothetical protein
MEINRGLLAPMLVKYLEKRENDWRVIDRVRRGIEFRELNLVGSWSGVPLTLGTRREATPPWSFMIRSGPAGWLEQRA